MKALKQKLITQIGVFAIYLILFIDNTEVTADASAVTDAMRNTIVSLTNPDGTVNKPTLQQVGDSAFATLETGAIISGNKKFIESVPFLQGIFDGIESGSGNIVSFFNGLIAGHRAEKAASQVALIGK